MLFGILVFPAMLALGAAIDYSVAASAKAELNGAADSATLLGAGSREITKPAAPARADAESFFRARVATVKRVSLDQVSVNVADSGLARTATVTYSASTPTYFMGIVGIQSITLQGTSTAASNLPAYVDFYLLLDNTPSMGVAATLGDIATMVSNTPDKCAFACHDLSNSNNYYNLAKRIGVTMRIDVVRSATQQLMDTAKNTAVVPGQFRAAIYTFGASCTNLGLTTIAPITTDLPGAKAAAADIDLMTIPYQGYNNDQCTDFNRTLSAVSDSISTPGDGSLPASPQKFLFFVTDGVADSYNPSTCSQPTTGGRCQEPLNVATCTAMKNRGIKIAVLYTTYLPLPTNAWYNTWIAPFSPKIAPAMQACASPGFYFEVSPTQGIAEAMNALFQKAIAQVRLTS